MVPGHDNILLTREVTGSIGLYNNTSGHSGTVFLSAHPATIILPKLTNQMPCYIVSRGADNKMKSLICRAAGRITQLLLLSAPLRGE